MMQKMHIGFQVTAAALLIIIIGVISFFVTERLESAITGKTLAQVYIEYTPPGNCTTVLYEGLNLASFYCETGDSNVTDVFVDSTNTTLDYYAVFSYNPHVINNSWKSYNPTLPSWVIQDLDKINRRQGYWVIMNSTGTYARSGLKFSSTTISLTDGWNLIGYPTDGSMPVANAISSINGTTTRIEAYRYQGGVPSWLYYNNPGGGTLDNLSQMEGYWLNSTSNTSWTVNW